MITDKLIGKGIIVKQIINNETIISKHYIITKTVAKNGEIPISESYYDITSERGVVEKTTYESVDTEGKLIIERFYYSEQGIKGELVLVIGGAGFGQATWLKNIGVSDNCFTKIIDRDSGELLARWDVYSYANSNWFMCVPGYMPTRTWKLRFEAGHIENGEDVVDDYREYDIVLVPRPSEYPDKANLVLYHGIEPYEIIKIPGPLEPTNYIVLIKRNWLFINNGTKEEIMHIDIDELDIDGNIIKTLLSYQTSDPIPPGGPYKITNDLKNYYDFSKTYNVGDILYLAISIWGEYTENKPTPPYKEKISMKIIGEHG